MVLAFSVSASYQDSMMAHPSDRELDESFQQEFHRCCATLVGSKHKCSHTIIVRAGTRPRIGQTGRCRAEPGESLAPGQLGSGTGPWAAPERRPSPSTTWRRRGRRAGRPRRRRGRPAMRSVSAPPRPRLREATRTARRSALLLREFQEAPLDLGVLVIVVQALELRVER